MCMITQFTPKGRAIETETFMDQFDLIEMDEIIDAQEAEPEREDDFEDPDSDGYGWERKALRGII